MAFQERDDQIRCGEPTSARGRPRKRERGGWRWRSADGGGARVAGEGRGSESGAAFGEARSALSSREPGERERTVCVSPYKGRG